MFFSAGLQGEGNCFSGNNFPLGCCVLFLLLLFFFVVIFTMHDLLHYEKALCQRHQNGSSTCEQMDKRLDDTVKKRDVDKGLGLATNLCLAALWVATQI